MARLKAGAAIDPVAVYRARGYCAQIGEERPAVVGGSGSIV